ncbi:MAG: TrmH family RNA methyltransferase [Caldisphaera sp.]
MRSLRLIIVGIEGSNNLGYLFRLSENFDVNEIYLVSPTASGIEALRYAVKGFNRLYDSIIVSTLPDALKDIDLSICTSDESSNDDILRTPITPKQAAILASNVKGKVALVLGRESVGLTRNEIKQCDVLCNIPSSSKYKALNVSNAASILLYELYIENNKQTSIEDSPDKRILDLIAAYSEALINGLFTKEENEDILIAIRRIAAKSRKGEATRLLKMLSKICVKQGCKDKLKLTENLKTK